MATNLCFRAINYQCVGVRLAGAQVAAGNMMATLTDTTLIIHCPYCLLGFENGPMIAHKDGRFVRRDCAHANTPQPQNTSAPAAPATAQPIPKKAELRFRCSWWATTFHGEPDVRLITTHQELITGKV